MKNALKIVATFLLSGCAIIYGCSKGHTTTGDTASPTQATPGFLAHARTGANHSQPIPLDTANRMIESYLTSQGYPGNEEALRSISIDADTLRAYLQDSRITTIKLMVAHQPAYINSGGYQKNAGLSSSAMTMVLVGVDEANKPVLNKSNGVYDQFSLCPKLCDAGADAYIHL